jgi:hypothetical protein
VLDPAADLVDAVEHALARGVHAPLERACLGTVLNDEGNGFLCGHARQPSKWCAAGMVLAPLRSMPSPYRDDAPRTPHEESTSELLGGLLTDAKDLVAAHVEHLELEFRGELGSLAETIKRTGIAIATFVIVGVLLGLCAASGLSAATGLPAWASFGIVSVVVAIIGLLVYRRRPASVDLVPRAAIAAIGRDVERVVDAAS